MKFEEILPLIKEGKMGCCGCDDKTYLRLSNNKTKLFWLTKDNDEYICDRGEEFFLRDDWILYEPEKDKFIKEKKLVDCIVFNTDYEFRLEEKIASLKAKGFEFLSSVENNEGSAWKFTLKMVKYED